MVVQSSCFRTLLWICSISLVGCIDIDVRDERAVGPSARNQSLGMRGVKQYTLGLAAALGIDVSQAFNAPSDVPTWCGKPYMSS